MQRENSQPRIQYPVKISFRNSGEIKTFSDEVKPKEFVSSRPALEELLKEAFRWKRYDTRRKPGKSRMKAEQQKWQISG